MGLARVLDFLLWSPRAAAHWHEVLQLLDRSGVKAAAWATLTWFEALAPRRLHPLLGSWRNAIRPGAVRAGYLELWLRHNLPSRLIAHPATIQFGWTAFLHDRPSDALVAYQGWRRARRNREIDARAFAALPLTAK
jgi:plasmid stabilization system protein ParE